MKIGLIFTPINHFKGLAEAIWSAKSQNDLQVYIEAQWQQPQRPLARAWNEGIRRAFADRCDYAIVSNDDILFSPDTIDALAAEYERLRHSKNVIMTSPNNIKLQLADDPYSIVNYERPADPFTFNEHPNFSCFLVAPEFFDLVGTFDENFTPAWYEDNDMHRRAGLLGYKLISTTAAPQVHFGSVSSRMLEGHTQLGSREYYLRKWGGVPVSHNTAEVKEHFATPYNDPNLSPKEWVPGR